jgi:hypothetical protein
LLGAASRDANQGGDHKYHPSLHVITYEHIVLYLAEGAHQPLTEDGSNAFDESRAEIFSIPLAEVGGVRSIKARRAAALGCRVSRPDQRIHRRSHGGGRR